MKKPFMKAPPDTEGYDWHDVRNYIHAKYGRDIYDWLNYKDNINNPKKDLSNIWYTDYKGAVYFNVSFNLNYYKEDWQKEAIQILEKEFGGSGIYCWVYNK